jgi:hypothetical protein
LTSIIELATGRGLPDTHLVGPTGTGPSGFVRTGPTTARLNWQVCATAVRSVARLSPTKPRVLSLTMPTRNRPELLERALRSLVTAMAPVA